jgi:hypothetical protein
VVAAMKMKMMVMVMVMVMGSMKRKTSAKQRMHAE